MVHAQVGTMEYNTRAMQKQLPGETKLSAPTLTTGRNDRHGWRTIQLGLIGQLPLHCPRAKLRPRYSITSTCAPCVPSSTSSRVQANRSRRDDRPAWRSIALCLAGQLPLHRPRVALQPLTDLVSLSLSLSLSFSSSRVTSEISSECFGYLRFQHFFSF